MDEENEGGIEMTNEKVMVTKEVADAIEVSVKNDISVRTMLRHNVHGDLYGVYAPLQTMGVDDLAKALLIGYEVEKSPEEKVAEYLAEAEDFRADATDGNYYEFCNGRIVGIKQTLDILGIKIERDDA